MIISTNMEKASEKNPKTIYNLKKQFQQVTNGVYQCHLVKSIFKNTTNTRDVSSIPGWETKILQACVGPPTPSLKKGLSIIISFLKRPSLPLNCRDRT